MTAYDVFISYSSVDRPWASKLAEALHKGGFTAFFDREGLVAGRPWEPQLNAAVANARHMVVLWSKSARESDWVTRERAAFDVLARQAGTASGKLLVLRLDATPSAFASLQEISELVPAYAAGPAALEPALWHSALSKVQEAIADDPNVVPVPIVVLSLTRSEFDELDAADVQKLAQRFGATPEALAKHYGATRDDWKPFGGTRTLATLEGEMQDAVNAELRKRLGAAAQRIRWDARADELWRDAVSTRAEVERLNSARMSVLLIDAVALNRHAVYQKLIMFQDCLSNPHCVILVVPPFAADQRYMELRRYLTETASPYFDRYFFPEIPPRQLVSPHCALGHGDADEMKRVLLASLAYSMSQPRATAPRTFLGV